jgi:phosphohistidine phosphatase SixA
MKHILRMSMLFVVLIGMAALMTAQDVEGCSAAGMTARIRDAYAVYTEGAASTDDMETTLNGVNTLTHTIEAIHDECDEVRYQAYVEAGTSLLEDLRSGGYILYVRHAATDRSQEDTDLSSCETQRNLSEQGKLDAAAIGTAWQTLALPVDQLVSTEYCRTRDTALIAFGEPTIINRADMETMLDEMLATQPMEGTNTVIVGHVDLLEAVTGIQVPEDTRFDEGDALIYRPLGGAMGDGGYELVGRISLRNWSDLARITTS